MNNPQKPRVRQGRVPFYGFQRDHGPANDFDFWPPELGEQNCCFLKPFISWSFVEEALRNEHSKLPLYLDFLDQPQRVTCRCFCEVRL